MWEYVFWRILDLSTVSTYEYVALIARYHAMNQSDTIDPRLLDRGFTEEQIKILMERSKESTMGNVTRSLNVRISGDLNRFDLNEFDYILSLYHIYDKTGSLPYPGSISEQPAKALEVIGIMERLIMESQHEEAKRREKERP